MTRPTQTKSQYTLLLVEDERLIAIAERRLLERAGYSVVEAHSGSEAVDAVAADQSIDLVLMDIDLGDGPDGVEAARRILELRELPIVFLTSHTEQDYVDLVKQVSSYGYVVKNSGEFVILRSIETAFELFHAHQRERQQTRQYRQLLQSSEEGILSYDRDGRVLAVNDRAAEYLGGVPEDFVGNTVPEILPEASAERGLATIRHVFETGESVRRKSTVPLHGRERHFDMRFEPIRNDEGKICSVLHMSRDTTEERAALEASRSAEEKYQLFADHSIDRVLLVDRNLKPTYVSPSVEEQVGYTLQDLADRSVIDNIYPDDRPKVTAKLESAIQESATVVKSTYRAITPRSDVRWEEAKAKLLYDDTGEFDGAIVVAQDITERKRLEEELRESEQTLRLVAENAQDVIAFYDVELTLRYISAAVERFGYTTDELADSSPLSVIHPDDTDTVLRAIHQVLQTKDDGVTIAHRFLTKSGAYAWMESTGKRLKDEDGQTLGFVVVARDITDRKNVEEELQAALEYKDHLMSELNHRVKNNLALVVSLIHLKQSAVGDDTDLSDISNQVNTIRSLHEKLQYAEDVSHVDVAPYVTDVVHSVISSQVGADVEREIGIADITIPTKTATALGLIISELATNAVKHGFVPDSRKRFAVTMETEEHSGECVLTVSNTGREFPQSINLENTTSLGLQLVTALTAQLGGTVELQRTPTPVFTIRFPQEA